MESLENFLGLFIIFSLILGLIIVILSFTIPNYKLSKYFKMNEKFFIINNLCGIICGSFGLLSIFLFSPDAIRSYLWRIILLPWVYLQLYTLIIVSIKKTSKIYDEKQDFDILKSAAITMVVMVIIVIFIEQLIQKNVLDIKLILPIYFFSMVLVYSIITLFLFKKA